MVFGEAHPQESNLMADKLEIDHGQLLEWVRESEDATVESRALSEKCRRYYDSEQWTDAEIKKLAKQKQAATVSNRIKPKMDTLMGMETANKTTAKAFPRTPPHQGAAEAATEAIRFVLQDNQFDSIRSSAFENMLIEGTGGCEVIVKPDKRNEKEFKILINWITWDRIIYDPHCRTKNFNPKTCRYCGQVVWMDLDEALVEYPAGAEVLESMTQGSTTYEDKPRWFDTRRKRVKIVELYYSEDGNIRYCCFTGGGLI